MDQAELDKSMKLLELVENDVSYVVVSSYLPESASTLVKGASNIGLRARIARSINAKNVNCHVCSMHVQPPLIIMHTCAYNITTGEWSP